MPLFPATKPAALAALPSSLAVVADDTTGACDVGGALAANGLPAVVELRDQVRVGHVTGVPVRAVEVRDASPKRASEEMAGAFKTMVGRGRSAHMLKIDSTLRGQIAPMLSGALRGSGHKAALVAPAFPAQGRHVVNGRLVVTGSGAVVMKELAPLLCHDTSTQVILSESDLGMSDQELLSHVTSEMARGRSVVIADGTCQRALNASARLWFALRETTLLVGSAGIAAAVADQWRYGVAKEATPPGKQPPDLPVDDSALAVPGTSTRVLVIIGSPAGDNAAQIARLRTLLGRQMDEPPEGGTADWAWGRPTVRVLSSLSDRSSEAERDRGSSSSSLASRATRYVGPNTPDAVVVVGGLTARRVLDAVGATAIAMAGEIVPGLPVGSVVGGSWNGVPLVTKAGAFGGASTLSTAVIALKGMVEK